VPSPRGCTRAKKQIQNANSSTDRTHCRHHNKKNIKILQHTRMIRINPQRCDTKIMQCTPHRPTRYNSHVLFGQDPFENCPLLGCYAASSDDSLPTFRENLSVPIWHGQELLILVNGVTNCGFVIVNIAYSILLFNILMTTVREIRTGTGVWTWAPLFRWTPWRWHSDTKTCGSWYSSYFVFYWVHLSDAILNIRKCTVWVT